MNFTDPTGLSWIDDWKHAGLEILGLALAAAGPSKTAREPDNPIAILFDDALATVGPEQAFALEVVLGEAAPARGGVYGLRKPGTGRVMRSGRTNDLMRRRGEHGRDSALQEFDFEVLHRTDSYPEQRGLEQLVSDEYNPPLNKIQPISPRNRRLAEYLDAAREFLDDLAGGTP